MRELISRTHVQGNTIRSQGLMTKIRHGPVSCHSGKVGVTDPGEVVDLGGGGTVKLRGKHSSAWLVSHGNFTMHICWGSAKHWRAGGIRSRGEFHRKLGSENSARQWPSNFMCWSWPPSTTSENDRKNPGKAVHRLCRTPASKRKRQASHPIRGGAAGSAPGF